MTVAPPPAEGIGRNDLPSEFRLRHFLTQLMAALVGLFVAPKTELGAVLVMVERGPSRWVEVFEPALRAGRLPLIGPSTPVHEGSSGVIFEVACRPRAERVVCGTIRAAAELLDGRDPDESSGRVLACPIPRTRYEAAGAITTRPELEPILRHIDARLTTATGVGVVVGLIDTDLHPDAIGWPISIDTIEIDDRGAEEHYRPRPILPWHATAVAALITSVAPDAELAFVAQPDNLKFWLSPALSELRRHARGRPLVTNLSLSFETHLLRLDHRETFESFVEGIMFDHHRDMVLIAAAGNVRGAEQRTPVAQPARSASVLAVCAGTVTGRLAAASRRGKPSGPWCVVSGGYADDDSPIGLLSLPSGKAFYGTSAACAVASGVAARHIQSVLNSEPGARWYAPDFLEKLGNLVVDDSGRLVW